MIRKRRGTRAHAAVTFCGGQGRPHTGVQLTDPWNRKREARRQRSRRPGEPSAVGPVAFRTYTGFARGDPTAELLLRTTEPRVSSPKTGAGQDCRAGGAIPGEGLKSGRAGRQTGRSCLTPISNPSFGALPTKHSSRCPHPVPTFSQRRESVSNLKRCFL